MKLSDLLEDPGTEMHSLSTIDIKGLTADSRSVEAGFLFVALPGSNFDGRAFVPDAIERGAVAVLSVDGTTLDTDAVALITDTNPRHRFAQFAARFYGAQPDTIAAVTGTNGKTSVAHFLRQIWQTAGHNAASLGTLGIQSNSVAESGNLTTPDPVTLHQHLADLQAHDVDHLAMEASSHGLDQCRLDGVKLRAAGFTNLSRDHLDYHGTMDSYLAAKLRLFADVMAPGGTAVINADIPECSAIVSACKKRGHTILTYGHKGTDLRLTSVEVDAAGQLVTAEIQECVAKFTLPLVGSFQVMNALCAAGLALATDVSAEQVTDALAHLHGVPGRLEHVGNRRNGARVYVDYAHTPSALTTALQALRSHTQNHLAVVFGAGGDRDAGKRILMGQAAKADADRIYVTDDNPRTEDAASIRQAILEGCPGAVEIADREDAIGQAVTDLEPGDVLLVAGKGHESGQIIGDTTVPFDDRDVSRAAIAAVETSP